MTSEGSKCPKCGENKMKYNQVWDKEFDRLDRNVPAGDLIHARLRDKGIPKYICSNCGYEKFE
jgi:DNA-directed RNA polymerase subunit M/transcription elongation factor TFIIS